MHFLCLGKNGNFIDGPSPVSGYVELLQRDISTRENAIAEECGKVRRLHEIGGLIVAQRVDGELFVALGAGVAVADPAFDVVDEEKVVGVSAIPVANFDDLFREANMMIWFKS